MRGYPSAGLAFNAGLKQCEADIAVFAHQDVYLPLGWEVRLCQWMEMLTQASPRWGVLGVYGVRGDGEHVGHLWCSGAGTVLGRPLEMPTDVASLDEVILMVRNGNGVKFDDQLPGYHLYGTDIALQARASGQGAYVVDAPIIHNTRPLWYLPRPYWRAYRYMTRKWRDVLPVQTTCSCLSRWGWPAQAIRGRYRFLVGQARWVRQWGGRIENLDLLAEQLGFEGAQVEHSPIRNGKGIEV